KHNISPSPREKHRHSGRGPVQLGFNSLDPPPRSPSPRTKRLMEAQSERERVRHDERNHGNSGRWRGSNRDAVERKERRRSEEQRRWRNNRSSRMALS
ncbi:hypothetical protein SESBI_51119, partial [Sesbania bispinosa]